MTYSIEKVTTLIGAHRFGEKTANIGFLLTDSRSLCFPEETLFFALKSGRNDGHGFIPDLYRRGVKNFVVDTVPADYATAYPDANFLKVLSPLEALQRLAERHRDEFDIPIVGITGSNGKTIVKEWLFQLLSPSYTVTRSPRSYNSQIGVPLSVWLLREQSQIGVFEAGISQPGEMLALHDIIQPTIGVITNIGTAHQENFRSVEEKVREKLILFHDANTIVYPYDNETIRQCVAEGDFKGEHIAWSEKDDNAPLYINKVEKGETETVISFIYKKGKEQKYVLPFIDEASIENSITCAAVCLSLGLSAEVMSERMAKIEAVAMRLEVKVGQHGCTLINDSYNSDINSLDIALDFISRRPDHKGRRRTLILSDILQSGIKKEELYKEVSELCVERGVEKFIGIGTDLMSQSDKINVGEKYFFQDCTSFINSPVFSTLRDEVILIKGARCFGFDNISDMLEQKVHETILEVNLRALVDNLNFYRSFMKPETKLVCMVKANAYGSGAVEVAKTLQDHRVNYLAVAVADEGEELRKEGISIPLIVMNPEFSSFNVLFENQLEPEVYSFRLLDAMIKETERRGITSYPIHIKIDTGMHRLGFQPEDVPEVCRRLKEQSGVVARSVFSHLVGSDSYIFDDFTKKQLDTFTRVAAELEAGLEYKVIKHILNSAGIERFTDYQMDMVRLGIGLYGVSASGQKGLRNISTLKTTILQIQNVPAGDSIGYSRMSYVKRDSRIAIIPIGYADGLDRHFSNGGGEVVINGHRCPIIGNICMDACMIDVTDTDAHEGDSVIIFGEELPVSELSDKLKTIPYEILTSISPRVKRVYYRE